MAKLQRELERAQAAGCAAVQEVEKAQTGRDEVLRCRREAEARCKAARKQVGVPDRGWMQGCKHSSGLSTGNLQRDGGTYNPSPEAM